METKEKQIEEMAKVIGSIIDRVYEGCAYTQCENCKYLEFGSEKCRSIAFAEECYNADYRKQSDVVRGVFEEAIEQIENVRDLVAQYYKDNEDDEGRQLEYRAQHLGLDKARYILLDLKKKHIGE